jgi:hypothetical protein
MKYVLLWTALMSTSAVACDRFINIHAYAHGETAVMTGNRMSLTKDGKTDEYEIEQTEDTPGKPGPMYDAFSLPRADDEVPFRVYRNGEYWVIDEDAFAPACQ